LFSFYRFFTEPGARSQKKAIGMLAAFLAGFAR